MLQYQGLEQTRAHAKRQAFEQLFFHLLERQRGYSSLGDENISRFAALMRGECGQRDNLDKPLRVVVFEYYSWLYEGKQNFLAPYFLSLYQLLKLIHYSELPLRTKILYANIVRASMSVDETFLLSVHALTERGAGFKDLIEWYGLLKYLREDERYESSRYGDNVPEVQRRKMWRYWNPDRIFSYENYAATAMMGADDRSKFWRENGGFPFKEESGSL